jgi:RNA 2',3'-cyclic 3'-phosphodiesterase
VRAFVAVEVGSGGERGGIAGPADHLTLVFLGEIGPDQLAAVRERLPPVGAAHAPFDLTVEGVGAFPSEDAPRVVWLGITDGRLAVERLARAVREALAPIVGAPAERFVPHVTWFRVRSPAARRAAREVLAGERLAPPPHTTRVGAFFLKESRLGPGGAQHRTIEAYPLRGSNEGLPTEAPSPGPRGV